MRSIALAACLSLLVQTALGAVLPAAKDVHVRGKILSLKPSPGCGTIFFGTPVTYQVVSGNSGLVGREVTVVVPCIEMPKMSGAVAHFSIGDSQDLVLTKINVHKIESPSSVPSEWFYLRAASVAK